MKDVKLSFQGKQVTVFIVDNKFKTKTEIWENLHLAS